MPVCNMCGDFTENLESHNFYFHRITQKTTDRINQVRVPDQLHYANYSNPARLQAQQYSWPTPPSSNEKNSQSSAAIGLLDELQHEPPNGSLRQCARPTIAFGEQLFRQPSQLQYFKPRTPPGRDREIFSQCPSVSSIPDTLIDGSVAAVGKVGNTLLQEGDRRHTKKLEKIWRIECRKTVDLQSQIQILKADLKTAEETIDELREKLSEVLRHVFSKVLMKLSTIVLCLKLLSTFSMKLKIRQSMSQITNQFLRMYWEMIYASKIQEGLLALGKIIKQMGL